MTLTLTVHRGTNEIGGSCIEIDGGSGERLILDAGRPLDAPLGAQELLPKTLDTNLPATVLFSHSHLDHWGLIDELPQHWHIMTGSKSAELMRLTAALFGRPVDRPIATWDSRSGPFAIGSFTVTPYLVDHSAFDAYMLLIEGADRRILYTGDFRTHGRKGKLVSHVMANPPPNIDVLIMEGTNLRSDKPSITENELESRFVELARTTPGRFFVNWSAQNIDRTVTLYRAAKRTGRSLVVDLYGADVLERVASGTNVPQPNAGFHLLKVLITPSGKYLYERRLDRGDFVKRMATGGSGISRRALVGRPAIIMLRDSMLNDFEREGLGFTNQDTYVFSSWTGYLDRDDQGSAWARARTAGARTVTLHTSGHASAQTLVDFAAAIGPRALVPVHGQSWDDPGIALPPVTRLQDGQLWTVP